MPINHDESSSQFNHVDESGNETGAMVRYRIEAGKFNIYSTFVPPAQRGGGIARELVDEAFDYAEGRGLETAASCSYAHKLLERRAG